MIFILDAKILFCGDWQNIFSLFLKLNFEKKEDAFEACFSWIFNFVRN